MMKSDSYYYDVKPQYKKAHTYQEVNSQIKPPKLKAMINVISTRTLRGRNSLQGAKFWSKEWTCSVDHHRRTKLMPSKHVSNSSPRHAKESTSWNSSEEPCDKHSLDILCHCAWYEPYQKKRKRSDVYYPSSIELEKDTIMLSVVPSVCRRHIQI